MKRQLGLTDDQAQRLQQTDDKFQRQRQEVTRDEREARQGLRMLLDDSTASPDGPRVEGYLNRLVQAQRKRADLLDAEQKDLAGFLTPVQRARFLALKEQLNRRISELGQQGEGRRGAAPPPP
ncbi:MAG TPA: Spy/CpxP family protein refolding chaperone [Gemmatimonadaceae bacterium]|nr:Spy/CpxP family protein refolding chaperone [Gemmatimonadaceae bacterium]